MPFSRYSRRPYSRRPWSRRMMLGRARTVARYKAQVPPPYRNALLFPKQGFPERLTVNLPYSKSTRVSPGVLYGAEYQFSLNNMTDLDVSGGGAVGQARGWDQWSPMYARYRVNYVKVTIQARQRASHGVRFVAVVNSSANAITSATEARPWELHGAIDLGLTAANTPPIKKTFIVNPGDVLGFTRAAYQGDDTTSGAVGGIPAVLAYLHLCGYQSDAATVCDWEFDVDYLVNVTLFDRADIAAS